MRTHGTRRSVVGRLVALGVIACGLVGGGCAKDQSADMMAESEELREQVGQLQAALDAAQGREASLEEENDRLARENAQLAGDLDAARQAPPPQQGRPTGFEGSGGSVSIRGSDIVVAVAGDVLFASGSVTLRNQAKSTLDQIAGVLNSRYGGNEIQIAGHTDNDPIRKSQWKTNERLSAERALAVEDYLASKGVSKDRMHIAGFGPARSKGSKDASRRVEIIVLGGA